MNLYVGDVVYCKIKGNSIVTSTSDKYDGEISLEIIGISPDGFYILYVPKYYNINHCWQIKREHINDCKIQDKFKGKLAIAMPVDKINKVIKKTPIQQDGMICIKCGRFNYMAEPNQANGTLICYSCRSSPVKMAK